MFAKIILTMTCLVGMKAVAADLPLQKLHVPEGFKISVWATVPRARSLSVAPDGRVFVGTREKDKVYVIDQKGQVKVFAEGLQVPNGVAYRDGKLYVGEIPRILEFDAGPKVSLPQTKYRVLPQTFPPDGHHGWKFIRFGPDGYLYVPVGANCNVCDPGKNYARLYKIDVHGTEKTEVAQGIRNTVGFDFQPGTKELWFTDNGRDMLGDDVPPDELNHLTKKDENFGFPFCHGKNILDPEFGKGHSCADSTPPVAELRAHVAALGMRFYTGKMFPAQYRNSIFFAEHGSWNRTKPQGYGLVWVEFNGTKMGAVHEGFVDGWLQGSEAWGRPVDVDVWTDGSLLISDDKAGVVYRLSYEGK